MIRFSRARCGWRTSWWTLAWAARCTTTSTSGYSTPPIPPRNAGEWIARSCRRYLNSSSIQVFGRLSTPKTQCPSRWRRSARFVPICPEAPVIRTLTAGSLERRDEGVLGAAERGRGGALDQHRDELARGGVAGEVHDRVPPRPPPEERLVGARPALDQDLLHPADARCVPLPRDPLRQLHEPLHPLDLRRVRDLVGHRRLLRPGPRRVDERERAVEPDLLDDLERLLEVGLGLAREADDDVGAEREVGDRGAQPLDEREVALARVGPAHRPQDPGGAGLERQVHVLADRVALGDRGDHRLAEVLRVRAREPDPLDPLDGVAGAQELAEVGPELGREVPPPRVHVLAEQRHLLDALGGELRHLGEDVARTPALLPPAHRRDDAVRAGRVAAHRHLHPRLERPLPVGRQRGRERAVLEPEAPARDARASRPEPVAEVRDRAGPEGDVDAREELEDALALRLRVAAADRDHPLGVLALAREGSAEVGGEPRVGLLADRARVEDDDVRLLGPRRLAEPELLEQALDPLRVVGVHLAAEGRDPVAAHAAQGSRGSRRAPPRRAPPARGCAVSDAGRAALFRAPPRRAPPGAACRCPWAAAGSASAAAQGSGGAGPSRPRPASSASGANPFASRRRAVAEGSAASRRRAAARSRSGGSAATAAVASAAATPSRRSSNRIPSSPYPRSASTSARRSA